MSQLRYRVTKDGKALESVRIGTKANLTLGRKSELCDVVLEHHTISRRHAVIMHRGDGKGCTDILGKVFILDEDGFNAIDGTFTRCT